MDLSRSLLCGCKMEVGGCSVVLSFTWGHKDITYPHILHINKTSNTKTSHLIVYCHYLTVNIKDTVAVCGIIKANHTDSFFSIQCFLGLTFVKIIFFVIIILHFMSTKGRVHHTHTHLLIPLDSIEQHSYLFNSSCFIC